MPSYRDVCDCRTKTTMTKKFDELLEECVQKFGGTKASHRKQQLSNIGYFAGYYNGKTRKRVYDWLEAVHPVFGNKTPTPQQAYAAGRKLAKGTR